MKQLKKQLLWSNIMKRTIFALAFAGLLMGFRILSGQTTDCHKRCQEQLMNCKNNCQTLGANAAGCDERCVKENAGCLSKCEAVKPDNDAADDDDAELDNDADYIDDSLDDDSEFED
jgi:hypothetical protein